MLECKEFTKTLSWKDKAAWNSIVTGARGFLSNHKAECYVELFENLAKNYGGMRSKMPILRTSSRRQGKHFHQDILDFERRQQAQSL